MTALAKSNPKSFDSPTFRVLWTIFVLVVLFVFMGLLAFVIQNIKTKNYQSSLNSRINKMESFCITNGGQWLKDFKECEGIDQTSCSSQLGKFNSCASACRHLSKTDACVETCVKVCSF